MRNQFPGYYRLLDEELGALWRGCTFALDASVLLNLYRYPEAAREELFTVFEHVKDRLWIPHHAALEFQRNRPRVVAEQMRRFNDVRGVLETGMNDLRLEMGKLQLERRHSSIDPAPLFDQMKDSVQRFLRQLDRLKEQQPDIQDRDPIRDRIDVLLDDRVGKPFDSQEILDQIYERGENRYARRTPPGYKDATKDGGGEPSEFEYGGSIFRRRFGDLIIWEQMIAHAEAQQIKKLVFLTDDEKEDWWWIVRSLGDRKLGPRPELVAEILLRGGVEGFHLYTSESFLELSSAYLDVAVREESISQVQDVRRIASRRMAARRRAATEATGAVALWLKDTMSGADVSLDRSGDEIADIVVSFEGESWSEVIGYQVLYLRDGRAVSPRLQDRLGRAFYEISQGRYERFGFVLAVEDEEHVAKLIELVDDRWEVPPGVFVIVGVLERGDGPFPDFVHRYEASSDDDHMES